MCGGFVGDVLDSVGDAVGDVVDFVDETIVDPVIDFGETFVKSLGQGVEDLFEGDLDEVLRNPAVRTVASVAFPQYAAYINLGAKAATGEEITAVDLAAAGLQGYSDLKGVKLPAGTEKAVTASAQIAEGKDPVQALASTYGPDWLEESGLDQQVKTALSKTVGEDYSNRITNTIDLNQTAADYAAGTSTERILANQFGDEVVSYLGAESPSQQALGFAGIETAVQKAEGASDQDALLAGAETYYDRGGQLPDIGQIASLGGFEELPDFDVNALIPKLNLDLPTVANLGFDLPSLSDYGFNLNQFNLQAPDILSQDLNFKDIADLGVDFGKINFEGYNPRDLGYNVGELADLGVDLGQLDLDFETLGLGLALQEQGQGKEFTPEGDEIASLENEFLVPEIETPFSQQVLGSLKVV